MVVDYERGRTQKKWLPRRLGGGKGDSRRARESKAAMLARELAEDAAMVANGRGGSPFRSGSSRPRSRSRDRASRHRSRSRDRRR